MSAKKEVLDALAQSWRASGICVGDTVLLHSSARRTMQRLCKSVDNACCEDLLESFLRAVDPEQGTLLFPLFNFDFAQGQPFDIRHTPSKMGALTEAARRHPGAVRTGHPMYSFAVIGKCSRLFEGLVNFSGYGRDSPFAILRALNGKIACLDLDDQHSMTMYHHVEEMHEVPYRFLKTFTGLYTDAGGVTREARFGLFVRRRERGIKTHVNPTSEMLWKLGKYRGHRPGEKSGLRTIAARDFYAVVSEIIKSGRAEGFLYRIENRHEKRSPQG